MTLTFPARNASFRSFRAMGWSITLPLSTFASSVTAGLTNISRSLVVGALVSSFGLFVLLVGYWLGGILDSYWMVPMILFCAPFEAFNAALHLGMTWKWVIIWDLYAVFIIGVLVGIGRSARSDGSVFSIVANIFRSLIPGYDHT